eukprot:jgi/Bigna1/79980/fgenesh1_pg.66_\
MCAVHAGCQLACLTCTRSFTGAGSFEGGGLGKRSFDEFSPGKDKKHPHSFESSGVTMRVPHDSTGRLFLLTITLFYLLALPAEARQRDYYKILGVRRNAKPRDIKKVRRVSLTSTFLLLRCAWDFHQHVGFALIPSSAHSALRRYRGKLTYQELRKCDESRQNHHRSSSSSIDRESARIFDMMQRGRSRTTRNGMWSTIACCAACEFARLALPQLQQRSLLEITHVCITGPAGFALKLGKIAWGGNFDENATTSLGSDANRERTDETPKSEGVFEEKRHGFPTCDKEKCDLRLGNARRVKLSLLMPMSPPSANRPFSMGSDNKAVEKVESLKAILRDGDEKEVACALRELASVSMTRAILSRTQVSKLLKAVSQGWGETVKTKARKLRREWRAVVRHGAMTKKFNDDADAEGATQKNRSNARPNTACRETSKKKSLTGEHPSVDETELKELTREDVLRFYSKSSDKPPGGGAGEKTKQPAEARLYNALSQIKDWRKVLSNFHSEEFAFEMPVPSGNGGDSSSEEKWKFQTAEHAFQASKFFVAGFQDCARRFVEGAKGYVGPSGLHARKGRKLIVLSKLQLRRWHEIRFEVMESIWAAKFSQCALARRTLLATNYAELWHIVQRGRPQRWAGLERLRGSMRSGRDSSAGT